MRCGASASALTAATILAADAAVTPTVSEMTYNVSSGTILNQRNLLSVVLYAVRLFFPERNIFAPTSFFGENIRIHFTTFSVLCRKHLNGIKS